MSLKIGAFNSNYRCECPNINEGFVFFGWRILFSDLAVLQNAALLSCPRGAGSVASRFANGAMPCASCRCFRVRADDGLYMAAALQNAALLSCPRGAGSVASRFANGAMPRTSCRCSRVQANDRLHMATALQIAALLSGSRGGQRDG